MASYGRLLHFKDICSNKPMKLMQRRNVYSMVNSLNGIGKYCINNEWKKAQNEFQVINPFNNKILGMAANCNSSDTLEAVKSANSAFYKWKSTHAEERSLILNKIADNLEKHKTNLSILISLEMGKPIKQSFIEVDMSISHFRWFASEALRMNGEILQTTAPRKHIVVRIPTGVVSLIAPWNFPLNMVTRPLSAIIAAGCTTVVKPSTETPLTAVYLFQILQESGLPPGVANLITCNDANVGEVGEVLSTNELVKQISFTGSTKTGKMLMKNGSGTVKRFSMELGGNAPFIVFPSSDVDFAVQNLKNVKFRNTGQACTSPNRIFVHESIFDEFLEKVTDACKSLIKGDPLSQETDVACLYNKKGTIKVNSIVQKAIEEGGKVVLGGSIDTSVSPNFFEPTIIINGNQNMEIFNNEIFGPVISIYKFKDDSEVLSLSNSVKHGLASYVFSKDYDQIMNVCNTLEYGMVCVNDTRTSNYFTPFCGVKESGIGQEMGPYGIKTYTDVKYISL